MQIGMNELADHTSEWLRKLRTSGEGLLVTRRQDIVVAITPARGVRHALEVPVRRLSRDTYSVIEEVRKRGEAATVTNRGTPVAVINPVSPEEERRYAAAMAAQSRKFMAKLRRADRDLEAGRAVTLDDALLEALPQDSPRIRQPATTRRSAPTRPSAPTRRAAVSRRSAATSRSARTRGRTSRAARG